MMNGVLMSNGIDGISVPAARAQEFNEKMVRFDLSGDATEMVDFLARVIRTSERLPRGFRPILASARAVRAERTVRVDSRARAYLFPSDGARS